MRKSILLFIILVSLVFTGCTVQGDDLVSINKELSAIKIKVAELEVENSRLKTELQHIKAESEQKQIVIDESDSAAADKSNLTQSPTPEATLTPVSTPAPTSIKPAPTPALKSTIQSTENKEITVYVTKTGAKYHSSGCRYLSKSKIPISLSSAKNNYTACSVCNPPR